MRSRLIGMLVAASLMSTSLSPTLHTHAKLPVRAVDSTSSANLGVRSPKGESRMHVVEAYGKLPLSFEKNHGQADRRVKFLSRGPNHSLLLMPTEAVLSLVNQGTPTRGAERTRPRECELRSSVLRMIMVGANPSPSIEGRNPLIGKSNYLIGNNRKEWHKDIPNYARVHYDDIYPGIDLVYYGNQRRLEYDFIVAPGANASDIRLKFEGANEIRLDSDGNVRLKLKDHEVIQPAPVIYQTAESGERKEIKGSYILKGSEVVFEIGDYDQNRKLVIDPQLVYATLYGGSNFDVANGIAVDATGNVYITGETTSLDLTLRGAFQGIAPDGGEDAFVVKLNSSGTDIIYATYLGSTNHTDVGEAIAVTSDGKACVTGTAQNGFNNSDFPTTPSRFQGNGFGLGNRDVDGFVTVLTPAGNDLFYSSFFGGAGIDSGFGIAVDAANKIYIVGDSSSFNLATKNAFQNSNGGGLRDAFVAKFDPSQSGNSSLVYSSFLGGSGTEFGKGIAVTSGGVAFFTGVTGSFNFPTRSPSSLPPFQTTQGGVNDSFIAKVSPTGSLIYSTFFGGNDRDEAQAIAVDSSERAYVTGFTRSSTATFPLHNAFNSTIGGGVIGFVAKLNADGTALFYSSFLPAATSVGRGIAVDTAGNAYVTGSAGANVLPISGFPAGVPSGNAFVAKIESSDATGTTTPSVLYVDTFGGGGTDGQAIAVDVRGNVYISGLATGNFLTTPGAFQGAFGGGEADAFIVKINSTFNDSIGVFRPATNQFLLRNSNTAGLPNINITFGEAGDLPIDGDWNGDGFNDIGVFRPSTGQFILGQFTFTGLRGDLTITTIVLNDFGRSGDLPVAGDWNGDGVDTVGVYRPSTAQFFLSNSPNTNGTSPQPFINFGLGQAGDSPLAGDWNGDGIDTVGVYRPSNTSFFLTNSFATVVDISLPLGATGDLPVVGDWNGDGVDTPGLFRPSSSTMFLSNAFAVVIDLTFNFGQTGDQPLAGDWNRRPDPFTPPNSGINDPAAGSSAVGQTQAFVTTCSDPDGWRDISTIDFKIEKSESPGNAVPLAFWVQFDQNNNLIRFYDPDTQIWSEGAPGSPAVLSSSFAELHLAETLVVGSGPTGPSVQIHWAVVFKNAAIRNNYKQYLKITDDAGLTTGFDRVGSWSVSR